MSAVDALNDRLKPPAPLDPDWVSAMMSVETDSATDARRYDPMQVANAGDPAFGIMQRGQEHTEIIDPSLQQRLAGKQQASYNSQRPANDRWDHAAVPAENRMDASTSITAGVGWLFTKAARFNQVHHEDGEVKSYTVQSGDIGGRIASKALQEIVWAK